jgi:hypothetical protein
LKKRAYLERPKHGNLSELLFKLLKNDAAFGEVLRCWGYFYVDGTRREALRFGESEYHTGDWYLKPKTIGYYRGIMAM